MYGGQHLIFVKHLLNQDLEFRICFDDRNLINNGKTGYHISFSPTVHGWFDLGLLPCDHNHFQLILFFELNYFRSFCSAGLAAVLVELGAIPGPS